MTNVAPSQQHFAHLIKFYYNHATLFACLQVVRHYHGHLSAIHSLDLHPTIDVLFTCGRDATTRVIILH